MSYRNGEEFKKLCKGLNIQNSDSYIDALQWKYLSIKYHSENYRHILNQISEKIKNTKVIDLMRSNELNIIFLKSEFEVVACIHETRTMFDVLLQIINTLLSTDKKDENKVTYRRIKEVLNNGKHNDKLPIFEKLKVLKNSEEYNYIEAFDNVVKHRKLIDEEYYLQFDKRGHEKDIRFKKFEYVDIRGNITPFSDKLANTVIDSYITKIINSIEDIGNCINKFLKESFNEQ